MISSLQFTDLQAKQIEWLEQHPNEQAAWLIVYWHHEENPETNGLSFYSGKDIVSLYKATCKGRQVHTVRGFDCLTRAIDMCRALRIAYAYAVALDKSLNRR